MLELIFHPADLLRFILFYSFAELSRTCSLFSGLILGPTQTLIYYCHELLNKLIHFFMESCSLSIVHFTVVCLVAT